MLSVLMPCWDVGATRLDDDSAPSHAVDPLVATENAAQVAAAQDAAGIFVL